MNTTTPSAEPMPELRPITTQLAKIEPDLPVVPSESTAVSPTITPAQARIEAVADVLHKGYENASTLVLTPDEAKALSADFPDEAFSLGAGGDPNLVYIEHAYLRQRLNQVLGVGAAVPIKRRDWGEEFEYFKDGKRAKAVRIYADVVLLVRGCVVGEAVGEAIYYPNNAKSNFGDALESARSNAFRRCCKDFGVGLQAWMKGWCEGWKQRQRKRPQDAPTPKTVHPKPENAPTSHSAPQNAVPAQHEATEKTREWMIKELAPVAERALAVFRSWDWLMPNEELKDLPLRYVPTNRAAMQTLLGEIAKADEPKQPPKEAAASDNDGGSDDWRSFKVPFGNDKGTPLDELDKKKLFGWWANFEVKDVDEDGNPRKPEWIESDQEFRDALDEAGHHYNFK